MSKCIFCKIVSGDVPAYIVWENDNHLAFLSRRPNTKGFTVVIPKKHLPSYAFGNDDDVLIELTLAAKKVAKLIDTAFDDVGRTGLIYEGFGVDHLHAKLFPMHGTEDMKEWKEIKSSTDKYFDSYEGYIASNDSKEVSDKELTKVAELIRQTNNT